MSGKFKALPSLKNLKIFVNIEILEFREKKKMNWVGVNLENEVFGKHKMDITSVRYKDRSNLRICFLKYFTYDCQ